MYSNKETEKDREKFMDKSTGLEMEQASDPQSLLEWFTEKYKEFGANLEVRLLNWKPCDDQTLINWFPVRFEQKSRGRSVRERVRRHWRLAPIQGRFHQPSRRRG